MISPFVVLTLTPGSVLEKKIDSGARLIFLGLKFLIFLVFWGLEKSLLFFWVEDFSLVFLG